MSAEVGPKPPTGAFLALPCQGVDALIIQGKRLGSAPVSGSEIAARTAVAAWLYHSGLARRLVCVEGEINRPHHPAGSVIVARLLQERYDIPPEAILARRWANCTRVEVRAIRVLARAHGWSRLAALTAGYHALRVSRLYTQLGLNVAVVPCAEDTLARLIPPADPLLYTRWVIPALAAARLPFTRRLEEEAKEVILRALLRADSQGVLERTLARLIRGA